MKYLPSKHSSWWRRLEDVFRLCLQKTSSIRLDQDEYVRLSLTSSEDVSKTYWSRPIYSSWPHAFKTFSRRFQEVFKTSRKNLFKTSSRCFEDVFRMSCQDVFKTSLKRLHNVLKNVFKISLRRLQDVLKTSSRHRQDVLQKYLQEVFKTYHQVKLFLLTRLWEAFNTFQRDSFRKRVIYRGTCLSNTTSDEFMVSVPNLQER